MMFALLFRRKVGEKTLRPTKTANFWSYFLLMINSVSSISDETQRANDANISLFINVKPN